MHTTGPQHIVVSAQEHGIALGQFLQEHITDAEPVLERGGIWVEKERTVDRERTLQAGTTVIIHRPPTTETADILIDQTAILYEDADLIALNKPAGVYVEMTPWDVHRHLRGALVQFLSKRDGQTPQLHLAHRLDRDTSGVLLLTKNPKINAALYKFFRDGLVQKQYLAECLGSPTFAEVEVVTGHGRSQHGFFRVYPAEEIGRELMNGSHVKSMQTFFQVIEQRAHSALVSAKPHTGRTHQIRLHLAHLGHPLVGDGKYGGPTEWAGQPVIHRLHATTLQLPNPRNRYETLVIDAPNPGWAEAQNH